LTSATVSNDNLLDRLAAQLAILQEASPRFSRLTNPKDLASQFSSVVSGVYPASPFGFYHRPPAEGAWTLLFDGGVGTDREPLLPAAESPLWSHTDAGVNRVLVAHRLADKSHVGMVLQGTDPAVLLNQLDVTCLRLILSLFDASYQRILAVRSEKNLVFSLNQRVLQLTSLIDTNIELTTLGEESSLHRLALERAAVLTNASRGSVTVRRGDEIKERSFFPEGGSGVRASSDDAGISAGFEFGGDSFTFELQGKESRTGISPFEETDQLLLDALSRQVRASLENRHLHHLALEKQKIEQELQVASSIQQRILPQTLPSVPGYDIAGTNIPSKSVGGDYYNCIPLRDGRYALVVADVTGKGVPAALLVSSLHAFLWAFFENPLPLDQLTRRLNAVTYSATTDDRFITAYIALLTPETGELECVSAGHNPAFVVRTDGSVEEMNDGGLALGMLELDLPYKTQKTILRPGERFLLYTDGVTEAANSNDVLYDSEVPLNQFVLRTKPERAEQFIQSLIADLKRFTGGAPQNDDITALYLLRREK
jgi:serine phosphatase RsbU (regulator of sigma subunit)